MVPRLGPGGPRPVGRGKGPGWRPPPTPPPGAPGPAAAGCGAARHRAVAPRARAGPGPGDGLPGAGRRGPGAAASGAGASPPAPEPGAGGSVWAGVRKGAGRAKRFVVGEGGLTKAKLAAMGTSALLSYGWVSNLNAVCLTIVSWITFAKSSGLSPLAPQQWKGFLAVYAGYYLTIGTAMRPIRISIAVAITPFFDRVVDFFQGKFQCSKPVAFGVTVFFTNILGTCTLMFLGLRFATWVTGVPLLP